MYISYNTSVAFHWHCFSILQGPNGPIGQKGEPGGPGGPVRSIDIYYVYIHSYSTLEHLITVQKTSKISCYKLYLRI
jgi:hypothetical protein